MKKNFRIFSLFFPKITGLKFINFLKKNLNKFDIIRFRTLFSILCIYSYIISRYLGNKVFSRKILSFCSGPHNFSRTPLRAQLFFIFWAFWGWRIRKTLVGHEEDWLARFTILLKKSFLFSQIFKRKSQKDSFFRSISCWFQAIISWIS